MHIISLKSNNIKHRLLAFLLELENAISFINLVSLIIKAKLFTSHHLFLFPEDDHFVIETRVGRLTMYFGVWV